MLRWRAVEGRLILLNALPLNIFPDSWREYAIQVRRIDVYVLKERVLRARKIKSYIRHQGTVETLQRVLGIPLPASADLYKYEEGDEVYIVTLKSPARGQEVQLVSEHDLDVYHIVAVKGVWL